MFCIFSACTLTFCRKKNDVGFILRYKRELWVVIISCVYTGNGVKACPDFQDEIEYVDAYYMRIST